MSSKTTHTIIGLAVGYGLAKWGDTSGWQTAALYIGAYLGSSAPDWMELPSSKRTAHLFSSDTHERVSVIPHRTITHTMLFWLLATAYSAYFIINYGPIWQALVFFAFCISGLAHLICDMSTPMGCPLLPFGKRYRITTSGIKQAHIIQKRTGWLL